MWKSELRSSLSISSNLRSPSFSSTPAVSNRPILLEAFVACPLPLFLTDSNLRLLSQFIKRLTGRLTRITASSTSGDASTELSCECTLLRRREPSIVRRTSSLVPLLLSCPTSATPSLKHTAYAHRSSNISSSLLDSKLTSCTIPSSSSSVRQLNLRSNDSSLSTYLRKSISSQHLPRSSQRSVCFDWSSARTRLEADVHSSRALFQPVFASLSLHHVVGTCPTSSPDAVPSLDMVVRSSRWVRDVGRRRREGGRGDGGGDRSNGVATSFSQLLEAQIFS